jgi:hypothetical protein
MVLLNGLKWHKPEVALKGLKDMLWGLEALRIFNDKLGKAIERIKEAKEKMESKCSWVSASRWVHSISMTCRLLTSQDREMIFARST